MKHSDLTKKEVDKFHKDLDKLVHKTFGHSSDEKKNVKEDLALMAQKAEMDHEVQMARSDLYKAAKYSIKLHEMLKQVSEQQGLEGWVAAKITKASDYLSSVYHYMEYEMMSQNESVEVDHSKKKTEGPLDYLRQLGRDVGAAWDELSNPKTKDIVKGDDIAVDNIRTIVADINNLGTTYGDIDPENLNSDVLYWYFDQYVLPGNEYLKPSVGTIPKNKVLKRNEWQGLVQKIMSVKPTFGKVDREPQAGQTAQPGQTKTSQTILGPDGQPAKVAASVDYKQQLAQKLDNSIQQEAEKQKGVDGKVCWKGYKRMGTKMKGGKRVDNCVPIKKK